MFKKSLRLLKIVTVIIGLGLLIPAQAYAESMEGGIYIGDPSTPVYVDGERLIARDVMGKPVPPFIVEDTIFVPLRAIGEKFSRAVAWDSETNSVIIGERPELLIKGTEGQFRSAKGFTDQYTFYTVNYKSITIYIDGKKLTPKDANGKTVEPFIINGNTYVPLRAIGEAFGKTVAWDGSVYIGKKPDAEIIRQHVLALAKENSAITTLYSIDPEETMRFVTELELIRDNKDARISTGIVAGVGSYDRKTFVSVRANTENEDHTMWWLTGDIIISQVNNMPTSYEATRLALLTIFGKEDADKVWAHMNRVLTDLYNEIFSEDVSGTINNYTYVISTTPPCGIDIVFIKNNSRYKLNWHDNLWYILSEK